MAEKIDIQAVYDISNDFFFPWLDERKIYSCAVWDSDTKTLEEAQINKLKRIADLAHIAKGHRVLDVGCGWGGTLKYFIETRQIASGIGLTLSTNQLEEIARMNVPGLNAYLISWQDYTPAEKFDAIVSIGAFEHFACIEDRSKGTIIDIYRNFFNRCHSWGKPGSYLALHTIIGGVKPRNRDDIENIRFNFQVTFQNSVVPFLEEVIIALRKYYDIEELVTIGYDYSKTAAEWLARFKAQKSFIIEKFGQKIYNEYEGYLAFVVRGFNQRYCSVAQMSLKRVDL